MRTWIHRYKIIAFVILAALVLAVACGLYWKKNGQVQDTFAQVTVSTIIESVYGIGTVYPKRTYDLKVGIPSVIEQMDVEEGDSIKKGEKLIDLDGMRTFYAPFDGVITSLRFKQGESVFPQTPILTLTDMHDLYLLVSVEQEGAIRVRPGQEARLSFESLRGQTFGGVVETVYSKDDRFWVRIRALHLPAFVLPSMTADVSIVIAKHDNAMLVPVVAIDGGRVKAKEKTSNKTQDVPVQILLVDGEMAQIQSNKLHPGDRVLLPKGK